MLWVNGVTKLEGEDDTNMISEGNEADAVLVVGVKDRPHVAGWRKNETSGPAGPLVLVCVRQRIND